MVANSLPASPQVAQDERLEVCLYLRQPDVSAEVQVQRGTDARPNWSCVHCHRCVAFLIVWFSM